MGFKFGSIGCADGNGRVVAVGKGAEVAGSLQVVIVGRSVVP